MGATPRSQQTRHLIPGHRPGRGRPKGSPNKATKEMRELARDLTTNNPKFVAKVKRQLEAGTCHPSIVNTLLHYAHGKPAERIEGAMRMPLQILHRTLRAGDDPLADPEDPDAVQPMSEVGR